MKDDTVVIFLLPLYISAIKLLFCIVFSRDAKQSAIFNRH